MKLKKLFAALLAVVLLMSCLPFAASAANEPSVLYVGEKDKTEDNLIPMLDAIGKSGNVRVIAIDRTTQAYYTLTYENGVGYVLTFYNSYNMSQIIDSRSSYCGLFCDGDLTVRLAGNITFDVNDPTYKGAYGWIVEGQLTIERALKDENGFDLPKNTPAVLTVNASKSKTRSDDESIGISAPTLMLHDVTVNACGGYAGVVAKEALVMADATLHANTAADMKNGEDCLFEYSVVTDNLIQIGGTIRADGPVDISAFYFRGGSHIFDEKVVVYGKDYVFAEQSYNGLWSNSFKLFRDPSSIPSCMKVLVESSVARIDGNSLLLNRRGETMLWLYIQCGRETIVMDARTVVCQVAWWQWIPYIFSFSWVDAVFSK